MKTFQLLLIYTLLCFQKTTAQENYKWLDSVSKVEKKLKKYDDAIFLVHKMLKVSKNEKQKAKSYYKLGLYFGYNEKNDSAFYYYNVSEKLYKNLNDSVKLMSILINKANILNGYSDYNKSDISAFEGLKYNNGKELNMVASIYNCLGLNSRQQKNEKEAINYYQKAFEFSTNGQHKIIYKANMANSYRYLKNYKSSIQILEALLTTSYIKKSKIMKARILDNLTYTKWLENPKLNISKELLSVKKIRESLNDYRGLIASNMHLSEIYKKTNQKKALQYAYAMLKNAKKVKATTTKIKALDVIIGLEVPKNIKKFALRRNFLVDSLQEVKKIQQLKYAKIKFHSEENKIKALKLEKEASENKYILEQEKNKKLVISFMALLGFLFSLFYLFYKKNQHKKEKLREVYNTEKRIAKRIHDELANDVFRTMSKVQNTPEKTPEIINDLNEIYLQTRDISHENNSIATGEKFEEELRFLLSDFSTTECKIITKNLTKTTLKELSPEKQIVIYRVLQELMVNIKKHSKASLAVVDFKEENNLYTIRVKDDGVGTTKENIKQGLLSTETRMKLIKGSITFETESQKGFEAILKFKK